MDSEISYLTEFFEKNPPSDLDSFEHVLKSIDIKFPEDYLEFMREFNGGEGAFVRDNGSGFGH